MEQEKQPYVSPVKIFHDKAKVLCRPYREARSQNERLNVCMDCQLQRCVVAEGNF